MIALGTIRAMRSKIVAAGDSQVAQIVAVIDALEQRGEADAFVAPLRARLATLRPARPIGFTRLLFTPIDPLVLPAPEWRRGSLAVPRSILEGLAIAIRERLPQEAAQIDAQARIGPVTENGLVELAGSLWRRAAGVLDSMPVPSNWAATTGLLDKDYHPLASAIAAVLGVAVDIQALVMLRQFAPEDAIRTILGRTVPRGSLALSAVTAVLLSRVSGSGLIVPLATEAAGCSPPRAVDIAVDHTLDTLLAAMEAGRGIGGSMAQAIQDTAHVVQLLREVEGGAANRPDRRRRVAQLRRAADALCRERFEKALHDEFLAKLDTLAPDPDDNSIVTLESAARNLRRLESLGRRLCTGEPYTAMLREVLTAIHRIDRTVRLADRVRLAEILVGAVEALQMLEHARSTIATPR